MWQEQLGVTVKLNNQDWNVFLENRKQGNFQIARNGWIADYNDPCSFLDMWYTGGGNNDAQYSNPDYDAKIDEAKATSVQEDRMKAFHEAEDILIGSGQRTCSDLFLYTAIHAEREYSGYVLHTTWILLLRLYIKNSRVNFLVGNLLCKPLTGAVLSQKCGRAVPVFLLRIDPD